MAVQVQSGRRSSIFLCKGTISGSFLFTIAYLIFVIRGHIVKVRVRDGRGPCVQDHHPTLWFSEDGARIGTYVGHNGAVNTCDVSSKL